MSEFMPSRIDGSVGLPASRRRRDGQALPESLPKVVGVKVSRKFGVDVDNVDVAPLRIANDGLGVLTRHRVGRFDIDAEGAVNLELEAGFGDRC